VAPLHPGRKNALLLVALLLVHFILMSSSVRSVEGISLLERGVVQVSRPVVGWASGAGSGVRDVREGYVDLRAAADEAKKLQARVRLLEREVERLRGEGRENERLRRLLLMRDHLTPRSLAASVATARVDDQSHVAVLDKGTEDGVRVDQAVVSWGGVVGRVVFADRRYSKVRLLTDPNSGVAGIVQRSRAEGMVLGRGVDLLEMAYVPHYADVLVGDRVVTSGLDGVFPKGLGIGSVVEVGEGAGASKSIRIRPDVSPDSLEEVLVLLEPRGTAILDLGVEEGVR